MALTLEQLREALVDGGGVTEKRFKEAAESKEAAEIGVDGFLVSHGDLKDEQIGQLIATWYKKPFVNLRTSSVTQEAIALLPESFAREHLVLPLDVSEKIIRIATNQPQDVVLLSMLEKYLRKQVQFEFATKRDLNDHMYVFQGDPDKLVTTILDEEVNSGGVDQSDTRIIRLVDTLLNAAYQGGASDVHIEPEDEKTVVRFRSDGVLHDVTEIPATLHESIMTRLKVMARLATDQHRAAQDGKLVVHTPQGDEVEIRLSIVPTTKSEKAVMRVMSDKNRQFSLSDLGLFPADFQKISRVIKEPWGMILVTGPTGSGKTTTLYSILKILNKREVNVTTIEDPVEYDMTGVNQIQVNEKTDLTFAKGLRAIVRQDPDIIMVGEIRDTETAGIGVNAAMTGHLVLSTLHTNDAATSFPRLVDMKVEDFLIASTVNAIIAQRLVRKICMSCIQSTPISKGELQLIEQVPKVKEYMKQITGREIDKDATFYKGAGCHVCHNSGFQGRIGIFEILISSDAIREAVMSRKNASEIHEIAEKEGMTTMLYDGLRKVTMGQTSLEEVLRVTR